MNQPPVPSGAHADYWKRMGQLKGVLVEGFSIDLTLDFLYRHNNTDLLILKNIKVPEGGTPQAFHSFSRAMLFPFFPKTHAHCLILCGCIVVIERDREPQLGAARGHSRRTRVRPSSLIPYI